MPGVPFSRGCDACRKQKKKCDQLKPACSRCARLKIECIGSGRQRYKFKNQSTKLDVVPKSQPASVVSPPSNGSTLLLSDFISTLGVIDVRYDLTYYGGFLSDIPRRLGTNDALDASVGALAAFPYMHTKKLSPGMLSKYGHALKTLRIHLSDPTKAYTPDALCAIYLMDICQSWIGRRDDLLQSHGEVMAHFLNAAPVDKWRDSFEVEMLVTISAAVAMESFANPKIQLDQFFAKLDDVHGKSYGPRRYFDEQRVPLSITLPNLANMGKYFRDPELYFVEIAAMYQESLVDYNMARQRLATATETLAIVRTPLESYPVIKQYTAIQAMVGLIGSIVLNLGSVLRVFSPDDLALSTEAARVSSEMMLLAQDAMQYRPLGSSYIPFCLVSTWAAVDGRSEQAEVERMLEERQSDFKETRWINMATWLKNGFEDLRLRLMLSQLRVTPSDSVSMIQDARMGGPNSCCIL